LLLQWVVAQIDILQRRARHRLDKIANRLELVEGYIIAYLNLDRVIEIIRTEDEPKPVMMAEFNLTDRQAEAILNMRLRSLRKLEEMELRGERDDLLKEQDELNKLLENPARQRTRLKRDLTTLRKDYAETTVLGRRRTDRGSRAHPRIQHGRHDRKGALTVILSARGWIRAASGHEPLDKEYKFKEGDGPAFVLHAQTTDKLLIACDNGRFYTLGCDKLPGARGFGEPVRSMVDIDADAHIVAMIVYHPKAQLLLAANTGRGFAAEADELLAETRKGRGDDSQGWRQTDGGARDTA
jgi:topoisomerase-4 subunit A